jgi:hypothetical protein
LALIQGLAGLRSRPFCQLSQTSRGVREILPLRPSAAPALLAISAHWYIGATAVTAMSMPPTIHDFLGFPPELHRFDYPAPGDPALARRVADLLSPLDVVADENDWGTFDRVYRTVFSPPYPARAVVGASLRGILVEISAVAAL